jgi:ketosteroid isomerase-like protein
MGTPTEIAKQAYSAFASRNIPALLEMLAEDVDWRFLASPATGTPYGGAFKGRQQVAGFFMKLAETTEILEFEPREFLEGPGHVTTIGRTKARALPDGKVHDTEWVQVCVLDSNAKIGRWIGTEDSAARLDK